MAAAEQNRCWRTYDTVPRCSLNLLVVLITLGSFLPLFSQCSTQLVFWMLVGSKTLMFLVFPFFTTRTLLSAGAQRTFLCGTWIT